MGKVSNLWSHAVLGLVAAACAPVGGNRVVKDCMLPDDQKGTLSGKWQVTPVPIAFRSGQFTDAEMTTIMDAADTWNQHYSLALNVRPIDYGSRATPRQLPASRPSALCQGAGIVSGSAFRGSVMIFKDSSWPFANPDAIALTSYCLAAATDGPLPQMYSAMMDLNTENFFREGTKVPDLNSIFVHEFGHLMGLDHSCDTRTHAGFPSCSDTEMPGDYLDAVMFPVIPFDEQGFGIPKRSLNSNDQGRANCLYMDFGNSS